MSNTIVAVDLFNTDEQAFLNSFVTDDFQKVLTRERVIKQLQTTATLTAEDVVDLVEGVRAKIEHLTDEEWKTVLLSMPFTLLYFEGEEIAD